MIGHKHKSVIIQFLNLEPIYSHGKKLSANIEISL